ncbi:23637_t:CDS:2, partial [Gigaspora margarita]
ISNPPIASPYFVGFMSIFAHDSTMSCDNCDPEIFVNDTENSNKIDLHRRITLIP